MNRLKVPLGMIPYDKLLNILLALWKTQFNTSNSSGNQPDAYAAGYSAGFEEALDAVAQVADLTEAFDVGKAIHRTKNRVKFDPNIEIIGSPATVVDRYLKSS